MTNIKYQGNQSKEEVVLLAEEEESPNRSIRKSRMKKMNKVGLVEGGMGQVIGVE